MSYDDWLTNPPPIESEPDPPPCVICGAPAQLTDELDALGKRAYSNYCGASCEQADAEGVA